MNPPGSGGGFAESQQRHLRKQLSVQIGCFKHIPIHSPDGTHADSGQLVNEMTAQTAATDNQYLLFSQKRALRFRQGGDIPFISGLHH